LKKEQLNRRRDSNSSHAGGSAEGGSPPVSLEPPPLDAVRKQLQSFGYLNNRIGKFYLSSISRTASYFLARFLLSIRVGVLTGTVAGFLMTAGTLLLNRDLLAKPFDVLLLFLYFELFFVVLFSFLELVLIYGVSAILRHAGGRTLILAGQAASFAVGLAFFGYFFYWGRTQGESLRLLSGISLVTIFIILTLSCIFVARCTWLGFLVAFRESDLGRTLPDWKRNSIEVMLALSAVLILLPFVLGRGENRTRSEVPLAVLTTPDRWIIVGIDGVSLQVVERLMPSVPFLQEVSRNSFRATLRISHPVIPPVAWTTIATGVSPAQHGILMPEVRRWGGVTSWMQITPFELALHSISVHAGFGQRQPVSGYLRKAKTFWEILSDSGIKTGVLNWWGSWPAEPIRGWNISERYYYKLMADEPPQNETFPPDLFQRYSAMNQKRKIDGPELDRIYASIFHDQLRRDPVRVAALYLPGLDILNYEFFQTRRLDPFTYTEKYRIHLQWLDQRLRTMLEENPDFNLMLILYQGRELTSDSSGVFLYGPGFPGAQGSTPVSETDMVPLILYTCGLPVAQGMSTAMIRASIPEKRMAGAPVRLVPAFPRRVSLAEPANAGEFNDLLIEQMKSLGYLQ